MLFIKNQPPWLAECTAWGLYLRLSKDVPPPLWRGFFLWGFWFYFFSYFKILIGFCFSSSVGRARGWKLRGRWFESSLKQSMFFTNLFFVYVLYFVKFSFITNYTNKTKNNLILLPDYALTYLSLHVKLSSSFYLSQLVDILAYEVLLPNKSKLKLGGSFNSNEYSNEYPTINPSTLKTNHSLLVYNFHSLINQDRFFIFILNSSSNLKSLNSVSDLFFSANWLEREVSELHGVNFSYKKDVRNLMLQYGDSSVPFQKSFPTIGLVEIFYNPIKDTLVHNPTTLQL